MKNRELLEVMKEPILKNRGKFLALALILAGESALSLLLPQILSVYIDGISDGKGAVSKSGGFLTARGAENGILLALALCALGYCAAVLLKGVVSAVNIQIGERLSWNMCDHLRVKLFGRIFSFDLQSHKMSAQGSFLEWLRPGEVTTDTAQLLAWTAAVLRKPGILLVDEFDAVISQETVSVIDGLMEKEFTGATILLVTHRKRSGIKADLQLTVENGREIHG